MLHILSMYFTHNASSMLFSNILLNLTESALYPYRSLVRRLCLCSASGVSLSHIDTICVWHIAYPCCWFLIWHTRIPTLMSVVWHDSEPYISMQNNCKWTTVSRATSSLISVTVSGFMRRLQLRVYCLVAACVYWTLQNSTHCTNQWVVSLSPSAQLSCTSLSRK
jgi:hypothetical protein